MTDRHTRRSRAAGLAWVAAWLLALTTTATAGGPRLFIGTNNTPLDRQVLEAVSIEAFGRAGLEFVLREMPSARSFKAADRGDIDGEGLRVAGIDESYPNLVQVPEPYTRISFVAFTRNPSIELADWSDLAPHRVAFINGWKRFESHASHARSVQRVDTADQLFRMLALDRIDLALYTLADGEALLRTREWPDIVALQPPLDEVDMFLYLHRRHTTRAPRIAAAIRDMKVDGTYDAIIGDILQPASP